MDPDDIIPGNKIQGSAAVNLGIGIPVVGRAGNIHRHLSGNIVRRYREPGFIRRPRGRTSHHAELTFATNNQRIGIPLAGHGITDTVAVCSHLHDTGIV